VETHQLGADPTGAHHAHTHPHRRRRDWGRSTARAVVLGTIAAGVVASAASAVPPYEPDESQEQGTYPDQPDDDGWGAGNSSNGGGSSTSNSPVVNGGTTASGGSWDQHVETDVLKITDPGIDFGDSNWVALIGEPFGPGSVEWDVDGGFYTPRLVGTLHLSGVSGQFGRMHVSYWAGGTHTEIRHSTSLHAPDNGHYERQVNLLPLLDWQIDEYRDQRRRRALRVRELQDAPSPVGRSTRRTGPSEELMARSGAATATATTPHLPKGWLSDLPACRQAVLRALGSAARLDGRFRCLARRRVSSSPGRLGGLDAMPRM
jgi:hypothetical protein